MSIASARAEDRLLAGALWQDHGLVFASAVGDIADLVAHRGTDTTETVYRKVIVPELRRGDEVMDRLFS